ncbi:MAG: SCP2 sterol-binding domain-containing protein [Saprospiraceae bacterium]|nr:SCP2 sterol-binding domain-containing protein [Saprospiraceae bacterium]
MTAKEFINTLPEKVKEEVLHDLETLFHFDLDGEGGGQFSVVVQNAAITVTETFEGDPKCLVKSEASFFMEVVTGKANPMMAVLMGKLKITNQGEMLKYAKIFGLM